MKQDYEQMEFDTRKELDKAVDRLADDAIDTVRAMINNCEEKPSAVRNRHEAYGIAAQHYNRIAYICKAIKNDVSSLLGTLDDPNYPAVEATSSIVNSTTAAVSVLLQAAAEMKRTMEDFYTAETFGVEDSDPMEEFAGAADFEDVENADEEA